MKSPIKAGNVSGNNFMAMRNAPLLITNFMHYSNISLICNLHFSLPIISCMAFDLGGQYPKYIHNGHNYSAMSNSII